MAIFRNLGLFGDKGAKGGVFLRPDHDGLQDSLGHAGAPGRVDQAVEIAGRGEKPKLQKHRRDVGRFQDGKAAGLLRAAVHPDLGRLDRADNRLGKAVSAGHGFGPGHVHQDLGHDIVLIRQVKTGEKVVAVMAFGKRGACGIGRLFGQGIDGRALRLALGKGIGVQRQEEIGPGLAGDGGAGLEGNEDVFLARHHDLKAAITEQKLFQLACEGQHEVGLALAIAFGAGVDAAMAGVKDDHDGTGASGKDNGNLRRVWRRPFGKVRTCCLGRERGRVSRDEHQADFGAGARSGHLGQGEALCSGKFDHQTRPTGSKTAGPQCADRIRQLQAPRLRPVDFAGVKDQAGRCVEEPHAPRYRLADRQRDRKPLPVGGHHRPLGLKPGQCRQILSNGRPGQQEGEEEGEKSDRALHRRPYPRFGRESKFAPDRRFTNWRPSPHPVDLRQNDCLWWRGCSTDAPGPRVGRAAAGQPEGLPMRLAALAVATCLALPAQAEMTTEERDAFRAEVRAYLLENPEVLVEAMDALQARDDAAAAKRDLQLLADNSAAIFNSSDDWAGGNPEGDVVLVEFIDYRCGYCRKAYSDVEELVKTDGNIRFVVKEFPILGEASLMSSQFAIAVRQLHGDDAYKAAHDALIALRGEPTTETLGRLATELGHEPQPVLERMASTEVMAVIEANHALADKLEISGTPTFVLKEMMVRGYVPLEPMRQIIAEVRG